MLKGLDFLHVLPAHKRRMSFKDTAEKDECIAFTLRAEAEGLEIPGSSRRIIKRAEDVIPFFNGLLGS